MFLCRRYGVQSVTVEGIASNMDAEYNVDLMNICIMTIQDASAVFKSLFITTWLMEIHIIGL